MRKLIGANLWRMLRHKAFWVSIFCMAAFGGFACFDRYRVMTLYGYEAALDDIFFAGYPLLGIVMAFFCTLFIGAEYSDGTIRNKMVAGCRRVDYYFATWITCVLAGLLMMLAYTAVVCACGIPLLGFFKAALPIVFQYMAIGLLLILAFAAIYTMASLLWSNKTLVAILCLLGVIGMLVISSGLISRLEEPEFHTGIMLDANGVMQESQPMPNPLYLDEEARALVRLALDILPTGQALRLPNMTAETPWRMMLCASAITLLCSLAGAWLFKRKDLK